MTDLAVEQRRVRRGGAVAALAYGATAAAAYAVLPALIALPAAAGERLAFAMAASGPQLLCLIVAVMLVSRGRYHSPDDIDGSAAGPASGRIAVRVAFLQNTLEQTVIATGANLLLAAAAGGAWLVLPLVGAALFPIGRAAFLAGYPSGAGGRAFGMALTMLPALVQVPVATALLALG